MHAQKDKTNCKKFNKVALKEALEDVFCLLFSNELKLQRVYLAFIKRYRQNNRICPSQIGKTS